MPVAQTNRDRLRGALLGPLGEETTDMLMEELNQRELRDHVDKRFAEVDRRFDQIDKRFDRLEARVDALSNAMIQFAHSSNRLVYTVSAAMIVLALATFAQIVWGG